MFQPNRMNDIDNFFMRNNNQVTPKRSYSPRLAPQLQQNQRGGSQIQYFPSNKENYLPNRTSVSPNKMNFNRKPMISGPGSNGGSNISPSLLISPRNKPSYQGHQVNSNSGFQNGYGGFQQELSRPHPLGKTSANNSQQGLLKRTPQNGSEVQFVMSRGVQYCDNHGNKIAEFKINIEGENMKYCSVCASKLASQGFAVCKIVSSSTPKAKSIPSYNQYKGNPFYEQIMEFLRQLVNVENHHYETIGRYTNLEQHYNNQIDMATQYYDEVLKILTQMKEEHISDLIEEKEKYLQISDIQVDYLNENVEEIIYMRQDIQTNIPSIVTDIEEDSFKQCIYEYRQKLTMLKHSIEEKEDNLKDVTTYTQNGLKTKVENFEQAMLQLWKDQPTQGQVTKKGRKTDDSQEQAEDSQPVSVKNMHDMLPKSSVQQTQGQGAFRHLFGDEEDVDETLPIPSPQFKKI